VSKIRVLIIEDNRLLRIGLGEVLNNQPDIKAQTVGGCIMDLEHAMGFKPQLVLLGALLVSCNSLNLVQRIKRESDRIEVIVIDYVPGQFETLKFVKAGVSGFILKNATQDELLRAIYSVAEGKKEFPSQLTRGLFGQIKRDGADTGIPDRLRTSVRLTKREQEVTELIASGMSNKEIAGHLNIAVDTVKSHVHNVFEKLAVNTRLELASLAHSDDVVKAQKNEDFDSPH